MRKYPMLLLIATLLLTATPAALAGGSDAEVLGDVVAAEQAWGLIGDGALLIDVRSAEEFAAGSIEGAVNIPHTEIDALAELIGADRDRPVVVFCRSGGRSGKAQSALEALGFTEVFNATGYTALQSTKPDCVKC